MSCAGVIIGSPWAGDSRLYVDKHTSAGFFLCLARQRHVNSHLVAVEVGVEGRTHQRMQLDRRTFDQHGFKRLDRQTVQRRRAVEQHQVVLDDFLKCVPYLGLDALDKALGGLDVMGMTLFHQAAHDERLEQLQRHLLGQTTLVQLPAWDRPRSPNDRNNPRACRAGSGGSAPACP